MARYTETGLRSLVRQLLMETKDTAATVSITNSLKSPLNVSEVYASSDEDREENLYDGDPITINVGETVAVSFLPTADGENFTVMLERPSAGVTPGYHRKEIALPFTLENNTASVTATSPADAEDAGDETQLTPDEIAALAQVGEMYEVVEDPTDPEFAYAVFYTAVPTRAVVVRAPAGDYKGDRAVSSKGQEISPRRYGGSFRKVAQALMDKIRADHPGV